MVVERRSCPLTEGRREIWAHWRLGSNPPRFGNPLCIAFPAAAAASRIQNLHRTRLRRTRKRHGILASDWALHYTPRPGRWAVWFHCFGQSFTLRALDPHGARPQSPGARKTRTWLSQSPITITNRSLGTYHTYCTFETCKCLPILVRRNCRTALGHACPNESRA